jgi:DNA polymerase-3 subunit gamma/tau
MSYQVFALKWRPQRFEDVVGQEHVTRTLQNAIREGRIPHAFLFTGARGVGKTTTARILAKALVCEQGPSPEPCNQCRFCRDVTAGSSMDIFEIDGASNRGIDDVRELRESLSYAPAAARYKIYIVDEVHMLTKEAFNAFLKTLEEPPPYVKFIFATTEINKVPITIQSRCQRFDFRLLDRGEIVEQLAKIVEAEGIQISRPALAAVAGAGEGSLRDAESLLDQVVAYSGKTVREEDVAPALGLPEEKTLLAFVGALLERRGGDCLRILDQLAATGMDPKVFGRQCLETLRHLAVLRTAPDLADLVPVTPETLAALRDLAGAASSGRLQSLFELFLRTESEIRNTTFPRMLLELAVIRAVRLEEVAEIDELLRRFEEAARQLPAGGGAPPAGPGPGGKAPAAVPTAPAAAAPVANEERPWEAYGAPQPPAAPPRAEAPPASPAASPAPEVSAAPAVAATDAAGIMAALMERAHRERIVLASFLEHGRLLSAGPDGIEIGFFPQDSLFLDTMKETENLTYLRRVARELLGGKVEVRLSLIENPEGAAETIQPRESDLKKKHRHEAIEHPAVQWALEIFQARVVDVKVV